MTYYGQFNGETLTNITDTTSFDVSTPVTTLAAQSIIRFESTKEWNQLTKDDLVQGGACIGCMPDADINFA